MKPFREDLLKAILSQPSAPFREGHVIKTITAALAAKKVPHFIDPIGNVVVGVSNKSEYLKLVKMNVQEPLRVFVAHMDHPGFHGVEWESTTRLQVKWHGGAPTQHVDGAKAWLANKLGWVGTGGNLTEVKLISSGKSIDTAVLVLNSEKIHEAHPVATHLYGGFQFRAPFWQDADLIYTKAADDLVGSFAITSIALDLLSNSKKSKTGKSPSIPFLGLLTRGEEVGFIGAIGHFELGWLNEAKRPIRCISLETSRTLPGAEIGKGPVVRLGDRTTVFDAAALKVFSDLAAEVLPGRHQRRIMDGGSCEATAATAYGLPSIGISVPLGNYHNQSFEGGPDSAGPMGPAPEFVHLQDVRGLLELCHGLLKPKLAWKKPWEEKVSQFRKDLRNYKALLQSGP